MTTRVLLLGGTTEGRALARELAAMPGVEPTTSLAGRVAAPERLPGAVRMGGFGGADGLAAYLLAEQVDLVVDATHPFAAGITRNAAEACAATGRPIVRIDRPGWMPGADDHWQEVDTVAEAAEASDRLGSRLFVTTGRQEAAAFAGVRAWCLLRSVEPPDPPLPADHEILLARGPFDVPGEIRLMTDHRIDCVVTKNSGGTATAAKLTAARELGVPVVMVRRPALPEGLACVPDPASALDWVRSRLTR